MAVPVTEGSGKQSPDCPSTPRPASIPVPVDDDNYSADSSIAEAPESDVNCTLRRRQSARKSIGESPRPEERTTTRIRGGSTAQSRKIGSVVAFAGNVGVRDAKPAREEESVESCARDNAVVAESGYVGYGIADRLERGGGLRALGSQSGRDGWQQCEGGGVGAGQAGAAEVGQFRFRILLAEDSPLNQKLMMRILQRAGHTVEAVADGQEALDALESGRFDLLILDLGLPTKSGMQVLTELRAKPAESMLKDIPVVISSGHVLEQHRRLCIEAGCNAFTAKPFRAKIITETVQAVMEEHLRSKSTGSPPRTASACGQSRTQTAVSPPTLPDDNTRTKVGPQTIPG